ncbi:MAG: pseudouridine synthase, partial [Pseudomonadota bacterium]|nr:pseudouridine synthase [Pseudomonadota bacterium]
MTTIKLNKKSDDTQVKASKPPVRRTDTTKRDRSVPPPKVVVPTRGHAQPESSDHSTKAVTPAAATRQRNHRFDGKLHGDENVRSEADSAGIISADVRPAEYRPSKPRPSERAPERSYNQPANRPERQARPAGIDTRTTPKGNKDEPQYR